MAVEITDSNWESLIAGDKPVVMDFWAEWCGPCRMISPIVEEAAQEYRDKVVVGKINIDDNSGITQNFGIRNIPTLLFFKGGELVDKHVGVIRKPELIEKINKLL
jgi:thioredoxin 1